MLYRKIPVLVEAELWDGEVFRDTPVWLDKAVTKGIIYFGYEDYLGKRHLMIKTPEGGIRCAPGDYIIRESSGNIYSYKPEIFFSSYEKVPT